MIKTLASFRVVSHDDRSNVFVQCCTYEHAIRPIDSFITTIAYTAISFCQTYRYHTYNTGKLNC